MTIIALTLQRLISLRVASPLARAQDVFSRINARGIVTIGCGVVIGSAIAMYLGAMAMLFHRGLQVQDASRVITRLEQDLLTSEIRLQERDAGFMQDHEAILQSMEKISSINYLSLESVAMLNPAGGTGAGSHSSAGQQ